MRYCVTVAGRLVFRGSRAACVQRAAIERAARGGAAGVRVERY